MAALDFDALRDLHNSANDLLHSPMVQQALVNQREEKWVHEVSEASLGMLDVCGISKDVLVLVKEHLQDLQFTLRRVSIIGQPYHICDKIEVYNCYKKKLKKETLKCLKSLKRLSKNKTISSNLVPKDHNLELVVDLLREVRVTTINIVESLLSLISIPWLDRNKRSFASRLVRGSEQDLYDVCDEIALQSANKRLEAVGIAIEDLELELQFLFRRLIQTRVLLLNILTI